MGDETGTETGETREAAEAGITPAPGSGSAGSTEDLAKVRELVLQAHPDVVPDLVRGGSVDELIASVEPARSAYQRVAEAVRGASAEVAVASAAAVETKQDTAAAPPAVPAGGATNVVDPGALAPTTKIARALAERQRR